MGGHSKPGANPLNMNAHQEVAPAGGYKNINIRQTNKARGPPGWFLWAASTFLFGLGVYRIAQANNESTNMLRETRETKMALSAFRRAEYDRLKLGELNALNSFEGEVMKKNKNWVTGESVYATRWMEPAASIQKKVDHINLK